ncbi:MAG: sensor domain-containing diguanylate cyclase [Gammaproteobacteria bacterium]|nr:sensor domain-containing diguanylate cyclase [Gammaproteobacteria bacterium]
MIKPPVPHNECRRQASLDATELVDSPQQERFDRYTRLVRRLFDVPIAAISLVDHDRQWFKSRQGLQAQETSRDISFCGHVVAADKTMVVEDALSDERFHDNPLVAGDPKIRFYAGSPISSPQGFSIGTVCIIDQDEREFTDEDKAALEDVAAMVSAELATVRLASIDALTGLSNRRAFRMLAEQSLSAARRNAHPAALIMIDMDGFKEINDQFGHATGDEALQQFAQLLLEVFRQSDIVARLGGDEFCVMLTETDRENAAIAVDRLVGKIVRYNERSDNAYELACSLGTIQFDENRHTGIDTLLKDADTLMYQRKRAKAAAPNTGTEG